MLENQGCKGVVVRDVVQPCAITTSMQLKASSSSCSHRKFLGFRLEPRMLEKNYGLPSFAERDDLNGCGLWLHDAGDSGVFKKLICESGGPSCIP